MGRSPKSLRELLKDRTFLARRHAELLILEPLVAEPVFRAAQERYRAESSELERQQLALDLEKALRDPDAYARLANAIDVAPNQVESPGALVRDEEVVQRIEEILAMPAVPIEIANDERATRRYYRAMRAADAVDDSEAARTIAARLSISVTTLRRELRWLEGLNLPSWLRPTTP